MMRRLAILSCVLGFAACAAPGGGPAAPAAPVRSAVVFFQPWSAALDASALSVIAGAAEAAKQHPGLPITVTGTADPTGSPQANIYLTETRAQVVLDQLVTDGVEAARIRPVAQGSVQPALNNQESRRVTIALGG
ncbi:MAG TPA: OmpA family protein [Acetobacteraceae bacterium]|nr:OmpA family protein [Acetobacteraceae bacterium]